MPLKRRRGKKKTILERRPRSGVRRDRLKKSRQLVQKKLLVKQHPSFVGETKPTIANTNISEVKKRNNGAGASEVVEIPDEGAFLIF